ncbi:MAG: hypothetical protein Q4G67_05770 [Actinomycetia bacterium]|nr:hypothetical protein [Actinomycetes bacterium]
MTWSPQPERAAPPVLGDPASIAALSASMHRVARLIAGAVEAVEPLTGPQRRQGGELREITREAARLVAEVERGAEALSEHGADLADSLGLAHRIVDRAAPLGLRVDGTVVQPAAGVLGVADAGAEETREQHRRRLQRVLDTVLIELDASRRAVQRRLESGRTDPRASRRTSR